MPTPKDPNESDMTEAQEKAFRDLVQIAGEHFNRALIVVDFECPGDDGSIATLAQWIGGKMAAIGMAEYVKGRMMGIRGPVDDDDGDCELEGGGES